MSVNAFCDDSGFGRDSQRVGPLPGAANSAAAPAGLAAQGDEAALAGRCPGNTYPQSSHEEMTAADERYHLAGGLDWLEWSSSVQWDRDAFEPLAAMLSAVKERCQLEGKPYEWVEILGVGPVRAGRTGGNRGGERGQHFDFKLAFENAPIFLAARHEADEKHPNVWAKLSGRACLLGGAWESYARVNRAIRAMGGEVVAEKLSRADLCLDIAELDVRELQEAVERGQCITRASSVEPRWNALTDRKTGFTAGKRPLRLTVYDKRMQVIQSADALYAQAMIDRRWGGQEPLKATRVEFQCAREWLREQGINSPCDFRQLQGAIAEKLTHEWFRIADRAVDRKNKNQSRAGTLPLWALVQDGFRRIFGECTGELVPVQRERIRPERLLKQARGCLMNAMLQMGWKVRTYPEFCLQSQRALHQLGMVEKDAEAFVEEYGRRETEFLT